MESAKLHLLRDLKLPDRFERVRTLLGPEVTKILVPPSSANSAALLNLALNVASRGEGAFVPVVGDSGAGKTTLSLSIGTFLPREFTPSVEHKGEVSYDSLNDTVRTLRTSLASNDHRIVPVVIDHREGSGPSSSELSAIKRFHRAPSIGARAVVLWPDTSADIATDMAQRYVAIADEPAIKLPMVVEGPPRETWTEIAINTLQVCNSVPSLAELGVDPAAYNPDEFTTIGRYMRRLSTEFNANLTRLITSTQKAITIVVVFVTEQQDPGVLDRLCNSTRYGLLDAAALLAATPDSIIGSWWAARRGLLIQCILQLNAHAFALTPPASVLSLRQFGPNNIITDLNGLGISSPGPKLLHQTWSRTDLGKFINGTLTSTREDRGTPADTTTSAFQLLAESGFTAGKDKSLNKAMEEALRGYMASAGVRCSESNSETQLPFCGLIPDNAFYIDDSVMCIEYTWRKGNFLGSANKSGVATYILQKLQAYARQLGWTND